MTPIQAPTQEEIHQHLHALNEAYTAYCDVAAHWYDQGYRERLHEAYTAFMMQSAWFERNAMNVRFVDGHYALVK